MFSFMNTPDQEEYKTVCSSIVPGILYLSGYLPANDISVLNDLSITHVVSIGDDDDFKIYQEHDGIIYKKILIKDSIRCHFTREILDDAIVFILSATSPVLIHCRAGVSRSATVAMAYLISVQKMSYRGATRLVKEKRPCVNPNTTFLRDLLEYEKTMGA
jgi:protein-tyrosine phosphatase